MQVRILAVAALGAGCASTVHATPKSPSIPTTNRAASTTPPMRPATKAPTPLGRWGTTMSHHHGLMLGMRLTEVWLWPEPFAETRPRILRQRYQEAFTNAPKWDSRAPVFQWDGDRWFINVIGHAGLGSELYLSARRCNFQPLGALALTAVSSAVWEYGYEASGVRPSALDLVYTPLSGLLIGESRHWLIQRAQTLDSGWRTFVTVLLDPFGEAERALGFPC